VAAILFGLGSVIALFGLIAFEALGPAPGTWIATRLSTATESVTAAHLAFSKRIPAIILNPTLVRDPLAITMSLVALIAVLIRRTLGTTLAAALVVTTLLIAFDPLVTPLLAQFLGDYLGVGLLLRVPWILPVGVALPALAIAWRARIHVDLPLAPLVAAAIIVGCAAPLVPAAAKAWMTRRDQVWADFPPATAVAQAIAADSSPDDTVLASKAVEFRVPAFDPKARMLAYRGLVGTVPHFPTDRVEEGVDRAYAVSAFFSAHHVPFLTTDDVATLRDYDVRYLAVGLADPRLGEFLAYPGYDLMLLENAGYALFRVHPDLIPDGRAPVGLSGGR